MPDPIRTGIMFDRKNPSEKTSRFHRILNGTCRSADLQLHHDLCALCHRDRCGLYSSSLSGFIHPFISVTIHVMPAYSTLCGRYF